MNIENKLLKKRDCPLEIELILHAGWTDVYLTVGGEQLFFGISNPTSLGYEKFSVLAKVLYFLSPDQDDYCYPGDLIEYVDGTFEEDGKHRDFIFIPFRTRFTWYEGRVNYSHWFLERKPDISSDFTVKLRIDIEREDENLKEYNFEFLYKDLCYAVAKAYTKALKKHGFAGYRSSTFCDDIDVNHLLYLKAVALDCLEIRKRSKHPSGHWEVTKLEDELELLLFDM